MIIPSLPRLGKWDPVIEGFENHESSWCCYNSHTYWLPIKSVVLLNKNGGGGFDACKSNPIRSFDDLLIVGSGNAPPPSGADSFVNRALIC